MSIEDKLAIEDLNVRYAMSIDSFDVDTWVDTFTPDGVFDEREVDMGIHEGHDRIRDWGNLIAASSARVLHLMANHLVTDVTATTARGTVYGLAEGESELTGRRRFHVLYEDEYVKLHGQWKFRSRVVRKRFPPEVVTAASDAA